MYETGDLGLVWMSEQLDFGSRKTDNLSMRGREKRKEKGEQAGGRWEGGGNKQRSDLEPDNSKFGLDSSIRYGSCQVLVWELRGEEENGMISHEQIRKLW